MEEALRESEERFRSLFENAVLGLYRTTPDGQILLANPALCKMLGYASFEELQQRNLEKDGFHPAYLRSSYKSEIEKNGVIIGLEASWTTSDGRRVFVRESARVIRDVAGKVLCYEGTVEDITERKQTEEALRASEERLRLAIQAGRMYAFDWDPVTDIIIRSPESGRVLGLGRDALRDTGNNFLSAVYPEDRERFRQLACEVTVKNPTYQIAYRINRPEGHMIWLEEAGHAFFAEGGRLLRVVGIAANITDRKRAEQAVLDLSGRLLNAQEEERCRVARELHDDIGQDLAVLALQIQQLASRNLKAQTADLQASIDGIATKVSRLAHQLHSSRLDYLGLGDATETFCREFSGASTLACLSCRRCGGCDFGSAKCPCFLNTENPLGPSAKFVLDFVLASAIKGSFGRCGKSPDDGLSRTYSFIGKTQQGGSERVLPEEPFFH